MAFEGTVLAAGYISLYLFAPPEFRGAEFLDPTVLLSASSVPAWAICVGMASYFVAISLTEVFYVAGSFGLYINRRIELEGWDVEIDFKRLARRIGRRTTEWVLPIVGAAAVSLVVLGAPGSTAAGTSPKSLEPDEQPGEAARDILEDDIFGKTREETQWVRVERGGEPFDLEMPSGFTELFGRIFQIALWVVVGAGLLIGLFFLFRHLDWGSPTERTEEPDRPDPEIYEPERDEVELPADLVDAAQRYWECGDAEDAFSLLYRGTLRHLADQYGLEIRPDTTARTCARLVQEAGGPGDFVGRLGRAWTSTAYAGRPPADDEARELFRDWRHHFRGGQR